LATIDIAPCLALRGKPQGCAHLYLDINFVDDILYRHRGIKRIKSPMNEGAIMVRCNRGFT